MTSTKLVIRVLDKGGKMLGWVEHQAVVRGDGTLRVADDFVVVADTEGIPHEASIHWCDVNVETRVQISTEGLEAKPGYHLAFFPKGHAIVTVGAMPKGLPPVTLRAPASVTVPTGGLGVVTNR